MQVTARSDRDLTPESIIQKVSDASGSKYSGSVSTPNSTGPPPPSSSKPAFTPTRNSAGGGGFDPLANTRARSNVARDTNVDEDGWGDDAPPITRTQLEKVQSSYQPTKVNMRELSSQKPEPSRFNGLLESNPAESRDVVKGTYQPVGKVDITALRKQSQGAGNVNDDRPNIVKGSYEPVGKVDIAAIGARAQKPTDAGLSSLGTPSSPGTGASARSNDHAEDQRSLPDRTAPLSSYERLTSLPKPKVANRFGSGTESFAGTKAPTPSGFGVESKPTPVAPSVGVGRTFADQGGKTPAQLWAENKARERGLSGAGESSKSSDVGGSAAPIPSQSSGSGEWKSGYGGKSWAPVQTTRTGQSAGSIGEQQTGQDGEAEADVPNSPSGGVGAIRDRFKGAPPMGAANVGITRSGPSPPPLDTSSKPNAGRGIPMPGLPTRRSNSQEQEEKDVPQLPSPPPQPPRSPTPPTPPTVESGSPIRVAMPVSRGKNEQKVEDAREEQFSPPPVMPMRSLAETIPREDELTEEPTGHDAARGAGEAIAAASFGSQAVDSANPGERESGKRALVQYDYEKAEDNELELREGEYVTNIEMVDEDWWMGQNPRGESGLFPSNYVELSGNDRPAGGYTTQEPGLELEQHVAGTSRTSQGATATALYDYDAAEENELSFPENAKITDVVSARTWPMCA